MVCRFEIRVGVALLVTCLTACVQGGGIGKLRTLRAAQEFGSLQVDKSFIGGALRIGSKTYKHGLGTHPDSEIVFALDGACVTFKAELGVDNNPDATKNGGAVEFVVKVDGGVRYTSPLIKVGQEPVPVSVDVSGGRRLVLVVGKGPNGHVGDHADWADARIVMKDGSEVRLSEVARRRPAAKSGSAQSGVGHSPEPPTATLTEREATELLEADWLFQAGDGATTERIVAEIGWTRALADRIRALDASIDLNSELRALAELAEGLPVPAPEAVAPRCPVPAGCVAHFPLESTDGGVLADASGGGHDARLTGTLRARRGVWCSSTLFTGRSKPVIGGGLSRVAAKPYTITAWVRTGAEHADLLGNGLVPGCVLLHIRDGRFRAHHWTAKSSNVLDGKIPISDGEWHHVAQVADDESISIFIDGVLDVSQPLKGKLIASAAALTIAGRGVEERGAAFRGDMDELCVFERALTPAELRELHAHGKAAVAQARKEDPVRYLAVRRVKRRIMFKHPAADFSGLTFIDTPYPNRYWVHEAAHRSGRNGSFGARLLVLDGLHPGGAVRKLMPQERPAALWRHDLSYDGRRVLFCMKPEGDRVFHLYEVNLDGTGLRQLTRGDYSDTDPIYTPSGHIVFTSSRGNSYSRCWPSDPGFVLMRCDADGRNIYFLSAGNEPDYMPAMLPDGRVLYTRWEYTDKEVMRMQSLWTVNPDGTGVSVYWGNQSHWPDMVMEARAVPGTNRVMFAGLGHHDVWSGSIGILDRSQGLNYPDGLTKVTQEIPWAEVGDGPDERAETADYHESGAYAAYKCPYPLSDDLFLVSARTGTPGRTTRSDPSRGFFAVYLMDTCGNRELVYRGAYNVLYPIPVRPRPRPALIPEQVAWPGPETPGVAVKPYTIYTGDVYEGLSGVPRGTVKYIRVLQQDSTTFSLGYKGQVPGDTKSRPHMHMGPPLGIAVDDGIKRVIGTVPVAEDGSAHFTAPPGEALHFQLLDAQYRTIQTMRSFVNGMPGETRGCVGCHELHSVAPPTGANTALRSAPATPDPPPWGSDCTLGYERDIQPILDRHCGKCHQGSGKARAKLDLTLRPSPDAGHFKEPYVTLVLGKTRKISHFPSRGCSVGIADTLLPQLTPVRPGDNETVPPMTALSYKSRLVQIAGSGKHNGVRVPSTELRKLIVWVDTLCPYRGEAEIRAMADPDPKRFLDDEWPWPPRMKTAPVIKRVFAQDRYLSQEDRVEEQFPGVATARP